MMAEYNGIRDSVSQIMAMKKRDLNGVAVVTNFIRRRVQPLLDRQHYGFEYTGPEDPARMTTKELSDGKILHSVQLVLRLVEKMP